MLSSYILNYTYEFLRKEFNMEQKRGFGWFDQNMKELQEEYIRILDLKKKISPKADAFKISMIYMTIGILWILMSDKLLNLFVKEFHIFKALQLYKGWIYVFITGGIFFYIVKRALQLYKCTIDKLLYGYEQLSTVHEELLATNEELQLQNEEVEKHRSSLVASEQRYELAVEGANDGIWDWDFETGVYFFSLKLKSTFGYETDEVDNTINSWTSLIHPEDWEKTKLTINEYSNKRSGNYESTYRVRCKSGEYRWILSKGKGVWDEQGKILRLAGSHTDITEKIKLEAKLQLIAYYDALTGLPNRAYLELEALKAMEKNQRFALISLDIDDFKHVNDTMGYDIGENFLKQFSKKLTNFFTDQDIIARINGDKFAIIMFQKENISDITFQLEQLLQLIRNPWEMEGNKYYITISIGGALYPAHGSDFASLMQKAEIAMYDQKERGKDGYNIYEASMYENSIRFVQMSSQLREAIEKKEFQLYYQPQIEVKTGKIVGVEALIRWKHPERGFVSPMEFIPFSEKTGYITEISEWVLKTAINQKRQWDKKGYQSIKVAVNLSGFVITENKAFENICAILEETMIKPGEIEVEVTETAVMMELDKAKDHLLRLREYGISIAMDDFGSGYSSLNYLHLLPFDIIKIDREFIKNVKDKEEDNFIYRTVVGLAHDMKLNVVAEGVETKEQESFLKKYNCDIGQGFLYSKPLPAAELEKLLEKQI
jgi:diguanylate cyclase (GGDEF)-like protein/PAS domain S-box-containing protein